MDQSLDDLCESLKQVIKDTYESGVTLEEAEKLAARFLHGQMLVASALQNCDLDSRMRKNGVKAIRAAVRTNEVKRHDKKPTESQLEDVVNLDLEVTQAQEDFDITEVKKEFLENCFGIFKDAHIYFRGIARGRFE